MQSRPHSLDRLLAIMARLRDPKDGCPWDLAQTPASIAPHTIEEAYEVAEAIAQGDPPALRDELGDLLFQVVFTARMAEEEGSFDFAAITEAICDKMERRHPHIFGDAHIADAAAQTVQWEAQKAAERQALAMTGTLDGVATALPAMTRAIKLQSRAARVGFDWPEAIRVIDKIYEEIEEVRTEIEHNGSADRLEDEVGDLLFVCVNLARKLSVDPENAVRRANRKFERRFRVIEEELRLDGRTPEQSTLAEMESLWLVAKRRERAATDD